MATAKTAVNQRSSNRVDEGFEEARTRKTTAEADIKEMEVAQAAGSLIPVDEVVSAWTDILANLKAKLLAIPVKTAPLVLNEDNLRAIETLIENQIHEALHELSQYDPSKNGKKRGSGDKGDEGAETAAPAKRKRVGRPTKATQLRSKR